MEQNAISSNVGINILLRCQQFHIVEQFHR